MRKRMGTRRKGHAGAHGYTTERACGSARVHDGKGMRERTGTRRKRMRERHSQRARRAYCTFPSDKRDPLMPSKPSQSAAEAADSSPKGGALKLELRSNNDCAQLNNCAQIIGCSFAPKQTMYCCSLYAERQAGSPHTIARAFSQQTRAAMAASVSSPQTNSPRSALSASQLQKMRRK